MKLLSKPLFFQLVWGAGFELQRGKDATLEGNVVAGTERGGFRIDGQLCGTAEPWANNMIHSGKENTITQHMGSVCNLVVNSFSLIVL